MEKYVNHFIGGTKGIQGTDLHNPTLRVLGILHLIDVSPEGITMAAISEQLSLPKGTISPILKTLVATGFVILEAGLYHIGFRSFELGLTYGNESDLLEIIRGQMKELVAEVGEICQFGMLSGVNVLYVLRENSDNPISIVSQVGKQLPGYVTALGKAMYSGRTDEWIEESFRDYEFEKHTENTITSYEEFLEQIQRIRQDGVAYDREELMYGIFCTAVPLRFDGETKCALSITAPVYRMNDKKKKQIKDALLEKKQLIEEISRVQGLHLNF